MMRYEIKYLYTDYYNYTGKLRSRYLPTLNPMSFYKEMDKFLL